ncbi:MAG: hypothetical protein HY650_14280 [Acidobacteria bacterium]|nr:hypothetical protein [Acidobacteriota bacterium]
MTLKHKIVVGVGMALVLIGAILGVVFYATRELPRESDAFLTLVEQGKIAEAYQSTAAEFRAGTSEEEFRRFLETTSLGEYQSASWSSRSIESERGKLEGTITTKSGGKIPLTMEFVKEGGAWKIYAMRKPRGGLTDETGESKPSLPTEAEAEQLARETLASFGQAVKVKDFTVFYESLSPIWKKETDVAGLQSNFQSFMSADLDLSAAIAAPIEWEGPASLDENDLHVLAGCMPEIPRPDSALTFDLKYHFGGARWELVGIEVNVR